jgi:hypothetical protein
MNPDLTRGFIFFVLALHSNDFLANIRCYHQLSIDLN